MSGVSQAGWPKNSWGKEALGENLTASHWLIMPPSPPLTGKPSLFHASLSLPGPLPTPRPPEGLTCSPEGCRGRSWCMLVGQQARYQMTEATGQKGGAAERGPRVSGEVSGVRDCGGRHYRPQRQAQ